MLTVGQLAQHLSTLDPTLPIGIIDIDRHPSSHGWAARQSRANAPSERRAGRRTVGRSATPPVVRQFGLRG